MKAIECKATAADRIASLAPAAKPPVDQHSDAAVDARLATLAAVDGVVCGVYVAVDFGKDVFGDGVNLSDAMGVLRKSVNAVNAGDLKQVEGMLLAQASALNGANGWTSERRARQAEQIRRWRPWERSTGPTSSSGKSTYRGTPIEEVIGRSCANWHGCFGINAKPLHGCLAHRL